MGGGWSRTEPGRRKREGNGWKSEGEKGRRRLKGRVSEGWSWNVEGRWERAYRNLGGKVFEKGGREEWVEGETRN